MENYKGPGYSIVMRYITRNETDVPLTPLQVSEATGCTRDYADKLLNYTDEQRADKDFQQERGSTVFVTGGMN